MELRVVFEVNIDVMPIVMKGRPHLNSHMLQSLVVSRPQAMLQELRPVQLSRVWWECLWARARCRLGAAEIAYDLRWDFSAVGSGNRSKPYTDVRATIARQHSSWRLSTVEIETFYLVIILYSFNAQPK